MLAANKDTIGNAMSDGSQCQPPSQWAVDDTDLLDEIDDIILRKLADLEQNGLQQKQLTRWASYYGRVYDLIYARLVSRSERNGAGLAFCEEAYEFLAESFWAKIENIYDPELDIGEQQANQIISRTRAKLERIEAALFDG